MNSHRFAVVLTLASALAVAVYWVAKPNSDEQPFHPNAAQTPEQSGADPGTVAADSGVQAEAPTKRAPPSADLTPNAHRVSVPQASTQPVGPRESLGTGRVVDEHGTGIRGITIAFVRNRGPIRILETTSDESGHFTIWAPPFTEAGAYTPTLLSDAYRTEHQASGGRDGEAVHLPCESDLTFRLTRRQGLVGIVRDAGTQTPLAGITLRLADQDIRSDAAGAFRLEDVPDGTLHVTDPSLTYVGTSIEKPLSQVVHGTLTVSLHPTGSARIRVLEKGTRQPIEDFAIRSWPVAASQDGFEGLRHQGTHRDGELRVLGLWPGANRLAVIPTNSQFGDSAVVEITPHRSDVVEVTLRRRHTIQVQAVDEADQPVPNLLVRLVSMRGIRPNGLRDLAESWRPEEDTHAFEKHIPIVVARARTDTHGMAWLGVDPTNQNLATVATFQRGPRQHQAYRLLREGAPQRFSKLRIPAAKAGVSSSSKTREVHAARQIQLNVLGAIPEGFDLEVRDLDMAAGIGSGGRIGSSRRQQPLHNDPLRWRRDSADSSTFWRDVDTSSSSPEALEVLLFDAKGRILGVRYKLFLQDRLRNSPPEGPLLITMDAPSFARIAGHIAVDGMPRQDLTVGAYVQSSLVATAPRDPDTGQFQLDMVPQGSEVCLRIEPCETFPRGWWSPQGAIDVLQDRFDLNLRFRTRTATIVVRDEDGDACPGIDFAVALPESELIYRTDDEGVLHIGGLPEAGFLRIHHYDRQYGGATGNRTILAIGLTASRRHYEDTMRITRPPSSSGR